MPLRDPESRQRRRAEAERQGRTYWPHQDPREAEPWQEAQRNFTDPDSRIMKNRAGVRFRRRPAGSEAARPTVEGRERALAGSV